MAPEVFFVTTTIPTRSGFATMAVVTEFDSLSELNAALVEDQTVYCAQLVFDKEGGQRTLRGARPCILGRGSIASITPHFEAINPEQLNAVLDDFDWGGDADENESQPADDL